MSEDEIGRYRQTTEPYPAIRVPPPGQFVQGYASVAGLGGVAPTAPGLDRQPAIDAALSELSERLGSLYEAVERLGGRLGPVLRPVAATSGNGQGEAPRAALPPLAEALRTEGRKAALIEAAVRSITDRIEV